MPTPLANAIGRHRSSIGRSAILTNINKRKDINTRQPKAKVGDVDVIE